MSKFHINGAGQIAPCRAKNGKCPFGGVDGESNHFDTQEEAQKFLDKRGAEEHGVLSGMGSLSFSKGELRLIRRASEADGESVRIQNVGGEVIEGMMYDYGDSFEVHDSDGVSHVVDFSKVVNFEQLSINGINIQRALKRASEASGEIVRIQKEDGEVIEGTFYDHGKSYEIYESDNSFHDVDLYKLLDFEQLTKDGIKINPETQEEKKEKDIANRRKLIEILENNGFYDYNEDDLANASSLELVSKASGDGYESHTIEVFDNDYDELKRLTEELNITLPDSVWYD